MPSDRVIGAPPMRVTPGVAALGWLVAFLVGGLVGGTIASSAGDPVPVWAIVTAASISWAAMIAMLVYVSREHGSGSISRDYGLSFRPVDAIGLGIGVVGQLVLVPLVYLPLQAAWPDTFDDDRLQEYARDLWDRSSGGWTIALVAMVVVGAPLVEELVYRGLLQGALARRVRDVLALVIVAAFFAAIHFRPIEAVGLFAIGLVFGACAMVTRRLGMGILAHVAFNITGLALAAR